MTYTIVFRFKGTKPPRVMRGLTLAEYVGMIATLGPVSNWPSDLLRYDVPTTREG